MGKRVFVYLAFMMFLCICTASANQVEINIKDKVTLKKKTIIIGDISTVTGDNVELVKKISNIEIGRTPWPNIQILFFPFLKSPPKHKIPARLRRSGGKVKNTLILRNEPVCC